MQLKSTLTIALSCALTPLYVSSCLVWLLQELATCIQYNLNVVHVILNDNAFGMIKWKQAGAGFENWGLELENPDFVAVAKSYGAYGHRVTCTDDFAPLLTKCLNEPGTHVLEVPFSYGWVSENLKTIPAQVIGVHKILDEEFGVSKEECYNCVGSTSESVGAGIKPAATPTPTPISSVVGGSAGPSMTTMIASKTSQFLPPSGPVQVAQRLQSTKTVRGEADYTVQKGSTLPFYLAVGTRCPYAYVASTKPSSDMIYFYRANR